LVNVFYSLHDTRTPTFALAVSAIVNLVFNIIGMKIWGVFGIAASTSFSALVLTYLLLMFLRKKHKFRFYSANYFNFLGRYLLQILFVCILFLILYLSFFKYLCCTEFYQLFYSGWGYWLLVFPLAALACGLIFFSRKFFGIKLYFLSK